MHHITLYIYIYINTNSNFRKNNIYIYICIYVMSIVFYLALDIRLLTQYLFVGFVPPAPAVPPEPADWLRWIIFVF